MAKVTGPAFSVDAHGELGDGICFTRCKSGNRVILAPKPRNPNSPSQSLHRASFHAAKDAWKDLSAASKAAYNAEGDALQMTGYNLFLRRTLTGEVAIPTWHYDSLERQIAANSDDCNVCFNMIPMIIWDPVYSREDAGWKSDELNRNGDGLRWLNIAIPQGATILTAHMHLKAVANGANDTCNTQICGDYEDNAANFTTVSDYMARRGTDVGGADNSKRTVAEVNWDAIAHWTTNTEYESPDISTVIQEIIDRPGWASGNAMALFWDDHKGRSSYLALREAYSHNWSPGWSPKLHITYKWFG